MYREGRRRRRSETRGELVSVIYALKGKIIKIAVISTGVDSYELWESFSHSDGDTV